MDKPARRPEELSRREKGYHDRDEERTEGAEQKEESDPSSPNRDDGAGPENRPSKTAESPTDCVLKIKTADSDTSRASRRNCSPDGTDSPASSSRPPPSPQYTAEPHASPRYRPEPPPQPWSYRSGEPHGQPGSAHHPGPAHHPEHLQPWHHAPAHAEPPSRPYAYQDHEPHSNVRLPSIAALLTEPYTPPPIRWVAAPPPVPSPLTAPAPPPAPTHDRYPPVVAALPLDDSRARTPQPMPQRKRGRLPKETTDFLKAWLHSHSAHPYPSEIEKKQMCHATGLSMSQVSNWMINGRRRILGPSYLSTSRSNPHSSPPVTLSSPSVTLSSPPVMLSSPSMMLRPPNGNPPSGSGS